MRQGLRVPARSNPVSRLSDWLHGQPRCL